MFERLPDLLTFKECQQALQIGKNSLLKYLHSGELDGFKLGSRWRIPGDKYFNNTTLRIADWCC